MLDFDRNVLSINATGVKNKAMRKSKGGHVLIDIMEYGDLVKIPEKFKNNALMQEIARRVSDQPKQAPALDTAVIENLRILKKGAVKRLKRAVKGIALVVPRKEEETTAIHVKVEGDMELPSKSEFCGVAVLDTKHAPVYAPLMPRQSSRKVLDIFTLWHVLEGGNHVRQLPWKMALTLQPFLANRQRGRSVWTRSRI